MAFSDIGIFLHQGRSSVKLVCSFGRLGNIPIRRRRTTTSKCTTTDIVSKSDYFKGGAGDMIGVVYQHKSHHIIPLCSPHLAHQRLHYVSLLRRSFSLACVPFSAISEEIVVRRNRMFLFPGLFFCVCVSQEDFACGWRAFNDSE